MQTGPKNEERNTNKTLLLQVRGVTKRFPGVLALDGVDLDIGEGEVHAVVGENGAGKSTLCNIITGIYVPDEGELSWQGEKIIFTHPRQALDVGIRMVYQERNLIPFLTGAQNICLGEEETKRGLVDEAKILARSEALRERLGTNVVLDVPINRLPPSSRQMIEIMRAFHREPKLLLLDEPTASLTEGDVETLFRVIDNIKKENISVVFISHKLPEVFRISDTISIFRNGQKVHTAPANELDRVTCIKYMINRDLTRQYPEVISSFTDEKLLEVEGVSEEGNVSDINLHVNKGEVVGFYGLVGSGRTELAELIYGLRHHSSGSIVLDGDELKLESPEDAISKGLLLVPEDRKEHGLFYNFNLKQNISISFLKKELSRSLGLIKLREESKLALDVANSPKLSLKYKDINQGIDELSGGNKQKVVIGRWVGQKYIRLMIMDEPTQGIDVGTKYEIYVLIRELAKQGIGVIFISSELPELLGVCDRLYVFKSGMIAGELQREEFDEEKVLHYALH